MLHENITTGDIHYLQNWSVADTTARDALSVVAADVGKVCQVTGTSAYYILTDDSPMTWQLIGSGAGGGTVTSVTSANADATVATTTTTPVITIVQAPALRSATTTVNVSSATAPTSGQVLTATSGTAATWQTPAAGGGGITLGTPVASTSGTSIDFTGIPAGTKYIDILLSGVSLDATTPLLIQLGDSGGFESTGYLGVSTELSVSGVDTSQFTSGFGIKNDSLSNDINGIVSLRLLDSATFTWACTSATGLGNKGFSTNGGGSKSLSAELTQVRITSFSGTANFDAGKINIQYQS